MTLVERETELGGQLRLAGAAPAHAELWERYRRSTTARLRAGRRRRCSWASAADADTGQHRQYDLVVLATGARPYEPAWRRPTSRSRRPGRRSRDPQARRRARSLVADWGGGWDGLDAAERLAGAGSGRDPGVRRHRPGRDASPVPAQPVPGPPRRARRRDPATTTSSRTSSSCATCSRAARGRCPRWPPSCWPRAASPRTRSGPSSRLGPTWSAPEMSSVPEPWRKPCSKEPWRSDEPTRFPDRRAARDSAAVPRVRRPRDPSHLPGRRRSRRRGPLGAVAQGGRRSA